MTMAHNKRLVFLFVLLSSCNESQVEKRLDGEQVNDIELTITVATEKGEFSKPKTIDHSSIKLIRPNSDQRGIYERICGTLTNGNTFELSAYLPFSEDGDMNYEYNYDANRSHSTSRWESCLNRKTRYVEFEGTSKLDSKTLFPSMLENAERRIKSIHGTFAVTGECKPVGEETKIEFELRFTDYKGHIREVVGKTSLPRLKDCIIPDRYR